MKTLHDLLSALPQTFEISGDPDTLITAPVTESDADLEAGGVFVARRGGSVDGHDFIPRAIERGAAAIIGEQAITGLAMPYIRVENAMEATGYLAAAYHDFPSRNLIVIGVTGTDGKTTTSTLIHSILKLATNNKAGLISTISADIGGMQLDTGFHVTTPSAPMIQKLLAQMVGNGLTHVVLEMTSHGLAQGRLNSVDIDAAVLTNLTHEHLDYHGTFENYRAAKGRMFEMLGTSFRKWKYQSKWAIINANDANADYFKSRYSSAIHVGFGAASNRKEWNFVYSALGAHFSPQNTEFKIVEFFRPMTDTPNNYTNLPQLHLQTALLGDFNVTNILAAVACVKSVMRMSDHKFAVHPLKLSDQAIQAGIAAVKTIPGRLERIDEGQNFLAIVDFAHTPNALKNALQVARTMTQNGGRVICVFGCAGLRDREKRRLMPEHAIKLADVSIFTAEDPRTESLDDILATMADAAVNVGGVEGDNFMRVLDRGEALYRACQIARAGDVVIACGKGHEQSMAFGTTEYLWDDRDAMRAALRGEALQTLPTANKSEP